MMPTATELIAQLKEKGLSYSQIGKALNRDPSLISQVARGKKPGSNLVTSLGQMLEGSKPDEPARRVAKSGEAAKVRQSTKSNPSLLVKDEQGRILNAAPTAKEYVFANRLKKIAANGGKVSFIIKHDGGKEFHLFRKGGIYAQKAQYQMLNSDMKPFEWLKDQAVQYQGNGSGSSDPFAINQIESVEINAVY